MADSIRKTSKTPDIPEELWMLWDGGWVVSEDDAPGGEALLCCTSEAEAEKAAEHQNDLYNFDCVPVKVK